MLIVAFFLKGDFGEETGSRNLKVIEIGFALAPPPPFFLLVCREENSVFPALF